jgi:hypothetical protein
MASSEGGRGPKGTHDGTVIANGNLYCPKTPRTLLELGPLVPGTAKQQSRSIPAGPGRAR